MDRPFGPLALLVALLLAAAPGTAVAAPGKLRATIAQAAPTVTAQAEELSEDPGLPNGNDEETDEGEEATGGGQDGESSAGDLPNTGAEPLLVALMGLGLLGTGLGMRRRIAHAGPRG